MISKIFNIFKTLMELKSTVCDMLIVIVNFVSPSLHNNTRDKILLPKFILSVESL